jgi:hypothetical protein
MPNFFDFLRGRSQTSYRAPARAPYPNELRVEVTLSSLIRNLADPVKYDFTFVLNNTSEDKMIAAIPFPSKIRCNFIDREWFIRDVENGSLDSSLNYAFRLVFHAVVTPSRTSSTNSWYRRKMWLLELPPGFAGVLAQIRPLVQDPLEPLSMPDWQIRYRKPDHISADHGPSGSYPVNIRLDFDLEAWKDGNINLFDLDERGHFHLDELECRLRADDPMA